MLNLFEVENPKNENVNYKFWQSGNHAIELYSEKFIWDKINYVHNNPAVEGFVSKAHEWKYSSASNYWNDEGMIKGVFCLKPKLGTVG